MGVGFGVMDSFAGSNQELPCVLQSEGPRTAAENVLLASGNWHVSPHSLLTTPILEIGGGEKEP